MEAESFTFGPGPRPNHRRAIAVGVLVGVLVASSIALANWLTNGNGLGRSHAGAMQSLTLSPSDVTSSGDLFPGTDGDLGFTVANPNNGPVSLTSVTSPGGFSYESTMQDAGICQLTINPGPLSSLAGSVIPGGGSTPFIVTDAVHMGAGADTSCQNKTFVVPVSVTATS